MYKDSYYTCLMIIRDMDGKIFGAWIDTIPLYKARAEFIGGHDSFVFTMKPQLAAFRSTCENDFIMLCQPDYMNIGAQDEGPAIHLDEQFSHCTTQRSKTFANPLLHGKTSGSALNNFGIQDLEIFVV